jgi:hypothetical protein
MHALALNSDPRTRLRPCASVPASVSGVPSTTGWWDFENARGIRVCLSVSVVSPCLKLRTEEMADREQNGRGIVGAPAETLGQVGPTQQSRGFQGETTGPQQVNR